MFRTIFTYEFSLPIREGILILEEQQDAWDEKLELWSKQLNSNKAKVKISVKMGKNDDSMVLHYMEKR